jgi:hypothetical protein
MSSRQLDPVAAWSNTTAALEAMLVRAGRADLLPSIACVRRFLGVLSTGNAPRESSALLGRAVGEIRLCIADPSREPTPVVFEALDAASPSHVRSEAREAGADSRVQSRAAASVLAGFADADEGTFSGLLAGIAPERRVVKARDELGTLREPLLARSPGDAGSRVLLKGELSSGLMADLLQLLAQNADSGSLVVEAPSARYAIYLDAGRVVHAESPEGTGEEAFFAAMAASEGRFAFQRGAVSAQATIGRSARELVMETLRRMDERA